MIETLSQLSETCRLFFHLPNLRGQNLSPCFLGRTSNGNFNFSKSNHSTSICFGFFEVVEIFLLYFNNISVDCIRGQIRFSRHF